MISRLEKIFSRRAPADDFPLPDNVTGLPNGSTVVIVGGGLAGSAFARQLLMLCHKEKKKYRVVLVNSTGCNYCGGLFTDLAREALHNLYGQDIREGTILKKVESCVYINNKGSVRINLPVPMTATLRTSRFGVTGFDDSLKERILEGLDEDVRPCLEIIEPTLVTGVAPLEEKGSNWRVTLSLRREDGEHRTIDSDLLVLATGFRSLNRPMLTEFAKITGYVPPPVMEASVAEIETGSARRNNIGQDMFIIDGIVPDAVVAFIPKGKEWLTMTVLGRKLAKEDLELLFAHPEVKKYIDLDNVGDHLRCRVICPATIFTGAARNFYGHGWVMLGDLTGYGRVLKDGYFASFLGAYLAAHTVVYRGTSREDWRQYYHRPLRQFEGDNRVGMLLYDINNRLNVRPWFSRLFMAAAEAEAEGGGSGGPIHAGIRGIANGKIPYSLIGVFFAIGLLKYMLHHPVKTVRLLNTKEAG